MFTIALASAWGDIDLVNAPMRRLTYEQATVRANALNAEMDRKQQPQSQWLVIRLDITVYNKLSHQWRFDEPEAFAPRNWTPILQSQDAYKNQ